MKHFHLPWLNLKKLLSYSNINIKIIINKIPDEHERSLVQIYMENNVLPIKKIDSLLNANVGLSIRQISCLNVFNKKNIVLKDHNTCLFSKKQIGKLLSFVSDIKLEIKDIGVIIYSPENAKFKARLLRNDKNCVILKIFLENSKGVLIDNPIIFGESEAKILDKNFRLYRMSSRILPEEAAILIASPKLPMDLLWRDDIKSVFHSIAMLGVDLSCLIDMVKDSDYKIKIILRIIIEISANNEISFIRFHIVTEFSKNSFNEEIEIPARGFLSPVYPIKTLKKGGDENIAYVVNFIKRPIENEENARNFLFKIGAMASNINNGFIVSGKNCLNVLSKFIDKKNIPSFICLDENVFPKIIKMPDVPILILKKKKDFRILIKISFGKYGDRLVIEFKKFFSLKDSGKLALFINNDVIVVFNDKFVLSLRVISDLLEFKSIDSFKLLGLAEASLLIKTLSKLVKISCNDELRKEINSFDPVEVKEDRVLPKALITNLRPYQVDAFAWMLRLERAGLGRLLADDMGLGKTIMTLSFIAKIKEMQGQAPSLVVAPTSVIDVWILEAKRHLPNIEILKWHGLSRFDKVKDIGSSDIVVTSFALLRRDACKVLNKVKFRHLIVDEAQYVKNCKTETWKIIKNIKAGQKIAITGTPIENSVNDIWSILEFLTPKILGDEKSFSRYYTIPIKNGNQFRLKELKNRIKPVVLRRNKKDVEKDLPKKIESIICCEMGEIQRSLYQNIVRGAEKEINKVSNFYKNSISFLSILTRLRQMCCDPSINLGNKSESGIPSAKKDLLIDVLNNCFAMKRKIIIYSQFLSMQKIIYKTIKTLGINEILWLHGGVKNRSEIIDKFQCDKSCRVIIISLKAGGSGITLTAADTIIYYDPWWNPAVEDQASDRAHRIGQTKNIHIIKLICKNTIEEQIIELSNKKRRSAEGILSNKTMSSTSLTFTEIKNLFLKEISNNK